MPDLEGLPLPMFRQPIQDPPLTPVSPPAEVGAPRDLPGEETGTREPDDPHAPLPPMPAPTDRTGTSGTSWVGRGHGAGDPRQAAKMVYGLAVILSGIAGWAVRRGGRTLRQPTPGDLQGFSNPLGRILVRYFDLAFVGPTLVDSTEAAAAVHLYLMDGPLTYRVQMAVPDESEQAA